MPSKRETEIHPKSEIRNKSKAANSKPPNALRLPDDTRLPGARWMAATVAGTPNVEADMPCRFGFGRFLLWICFGFRYSDFVLGPTGQPLALRCQRNRP